MRPSLRTPLAVLLLALGLGLLGAPGAQAAPYAVQACLPGNPGPLASGLLVASASGRAAGGRFRTRDACSSQQVAKATLRAGRPLRSGDAGRLTLNAGVGTAITSLTYARQVTVTRQRYEYRLVARIGPARRGVVLESCTGPDACGALNRRPFSGTVPPGTTAVSAELSCAAAARRTCVRVPDGRAAATVVVTALVATVDDQAAPVFAEQPSGDLLAPSTALTGPRSVRVTASDVGSGLRSVGLVIDGRLVQEQPYDARPCASPTASLTACPGRGTRVITFDTAALRNGGHLLAVRLTDAVGNTTDSLGAAITTQNPGQAGTAVRLLPTLRLAGEAAPVSGVVRYGDPAELTGIVADVTGAPLPGVGVTVVAVSPEGTATNESYRLTTDASGAFATPVRTGASRRFLVLAAAGGGLAAGATTDLRVRPTVSLAVRRTGSLGTISGSIPLTGRSYDINIQAFADGSWIPFQRVTTRTDGTFTTRYRFLGKGPYRLRALFGAQEDFERSTSPVRIVRIPR